MKESGFQGWGQIFSTASPSQNLNSCANASPPEVIGARSNEAIRTRRATGNALMVPRPGLVCDFAGSTIRSLFLREGLLSLILHRVERLVGHV